MQHWISISYLVWPGSTTNKVQENYFSGTLFIHCLIAVAFILIRQKSLTHAIQDTSIWHWSSTPLTQVVFLFQRFVFSFSYLLLRVFSLQCINCLYRLWVECPFWDLLLLKLPQLYDLYFFGIVVKTVVVIRDFSVFKENKFI